MAKYFVRLSFSSALSSEIEAIDEREAIGAAHRQYKDHLANFGICFNDLEVECHEITWRDDENYAGILFMYGAPSYEFDKCPVWVLKEDKGLILDHGALVGFGVDHENKIFDVWHDGHFVDYGEDYYQAYFDYASEKELLDE